MQLPFIAKVMENHDFTIIPVMVGHLSSEKAALYGKIFAPYLADPSNLFVISTDFCHWGKFYLSSVLKVVDNYHESCIFYGRFSI